jgi:hypothetical protein
MRPAISSSSSTCDDRDPAALLAAELRTLAGSGASVLSIRSKCTDSINIPVLQTYARVEGLSASAGLYRLVRQVIDECWDVGDDRGARILELALAVESPRQQAAGTVADDPSFASRKAAILRLVGGEFADVSQTAWKDWSSNQLSRRILPAFADQVLQLALNKVEARSPLVGEAGPSS